jgi:hypothetical protein
MESTGIAPCLTARNNSIYELEGAKVSRIEGLYLKETGLGKG